MSFASIPIHIAIIMDGNGRWAKSHGLKRIKGHEEAEKSIHATVEFCGEIGVKYLTLFAFSTENWNRPKAEVAFIMKLLSTFINRNIDSLDNSNVRIRATGRLWDLPDNARETLKKAMDRTASNSGLHLILALSYGGRSEITDAVYSIAEKVSKGEIQFRDISEETITSHLYLPDVPDPDFLIRTSGELRISNFLLWECAYTELYFTDVLWPDFRREHLILALEEFNRRNRRFGRIEAVKK